MFYAACESCIALICGRFVFAIRKVGQFRSVLTAISDCSPGSRAGARDRSDPRA